MTGKNRYILLESALSVISIILLLALLWQVIPLYYSIIIILGLVSGLCFTWLVADKVSVVINLWFLRTKDRVLPRSRVSIGECIKLILSIGMLIILGWLAYSLINSPLIYKEMVLRSLKGIFILEVLLSFGCILPGVSSYMQILSLPLFMSHAVWIKSYSAISIILVLGYLFLWPVILKVRFYHHFESINATQAKKNYSFYLLIIFLTVCLAISWLLSAKLLLIKSPKEGFLASEERASGKELDELSDKEVFDLQNKLVNKVTKIILNIGPKKEQSETLLLLNKLINESPYVLEVKDAEAGLISRLKTPGPGLDPDESEGAVILAKEYLDKKILQNLRNNTEIINTNLKSNPYGIKNRITIMDKFNKIQDSSTAEDMNKNAKELDKIINESLVGDPAKDELRQSLRQYQEWKILQDYRALTKVLNRVIASLDEFTKKDVNAIAETIDQAKSLSAFRDIDEAVGDLQNRSVSLESKEAMQIIVQLRNLKLEMLISQENKEASAALEKAGSYKEENGQLKEKLDAVRKTTNPQELVEDVKRIKEDIADDMRDIPQKVKEYLDDKIALLAEDKVKEIQDVLRETGLLDSKKELSEQIKKLAANKDKASLSSAAEKIQAQIDMAYRDGFISQKPKEELKNKIEELTKLLDSRLAVNEKKMVKDEQTQEKGKIDYHTGINKMVSNSFMNGDQKEALLDLNDELDNAKTLNRLEILKEGINKQLESLDKSKLKKEDLDKLKKEFASSVKMRRKMIISQSNYALSRNLEELNKVSPKGANYMEGSLGKIRDTETNAQLQEKINSLEGYFDSQRQKLEQDIISFKEASADKLSEINQNKLNGASLPVICILPKRLILTSGSSAALKVIEVFDNKLIRDVSTQLSWLISAPAVVSIDKEGIVHALSPGIAEVVGEYKGARSNNAEIAVVDMIPDDTYLEFKSAITR